MRKINVYKFSEKMPEKGVTIAMIPKSDCVYTGRLVDKVIEWDDGYYDTNIEYLMDWEWMEVSK